MHNACSSCMNSRLHVPEQLPPSPLHFDWQGRNHGDRKCLECLLTAEDLVVRGNILTWAAELLKSTLIEHVWVLKLSIPAQNALGGFCRWCLISVFTESCMCKTFNLYFGSADLNIIFETCIAVSGSTNLLNKQHKVNQIYK